MIRGFGRMPPRAPLLAAPALAVRWQSTPSMSAAERKAYVAAMLIPRLRGHDNSGVSHIAAEYARYFDHMRFRKGWAEPRYTKAALGPLFEEAAEFVFRIRQTLDEWEPGQKIRLVDGDAQTFLHSDAGEALFKKEDRVPFVRALVHASMKDAMGYVEHLDGAQVDAFLDVLLRHRYNPQVHSAHVLREMQAVLEANPLALQPGGSESEYLPDGTEEDTKWRTAIGRAYAALDAFVAVGEVRAASAKPAHKGDSVPAPEPTPTPAADAAAAAPAAAVAAAMTQEPSAVPEAETTSPAIVPDAEG